MNKYAIKTVNTNFQKIFRPFYIPGSVFSLDMHWEKTTYNHQFNFFNRVKFLTKDSLVCLTEELKRVD